MGPPQSDRSQVHQAFINLVVYLVGGVVVLCFYLNYYILEQYFIALFWAAVISIPLWQVKTHLLVSFLEWSVSSVMIEHEDGVVVGGDLHEDGVEYVVRINMVCAV